MRQPGAWFALAALVLAAPAGAVTQIDELKTPDGKHTALVDRSGKGAVLCSWSVLVLAQEVGRQCPAVRDASLQTELDRAVAKTDAFILKNSSRRVTRADLAGWKVQAIRHDEPGGICTGEPLALYAEVKKAGPAHVRASTEELLSVPREPVMNPCF